MKAKASTERLTVQVTPELKRALREQAGRAGLSLSDWVRTRLELEGTNPEDVRALASELAKLEGRLKRTAAELAASEAKAKAWERNKPAMEAAIRAAVEDEFRELGIGSGWRPDSASR
jgi:hypothetical protein